MMFKERFEEEKWNVKFKIDIVFKKGIQNMKKFIAHIACWLGVSLISLSDFFRTNQIYNSLFLFGLGFVFYALILSIHKVMNDY